MKTVLIVEDVEDNRKLVEKTLQGRYRLWEAVDGEEGLELAAEKHPDLVLLDLSLPTIGGWEVAQTLKANPELKDIPIVALTAHAMPGDEEKAKEAGCEHYLTKPFRPIHLRELVAEILGE